MLSTFLVTGTGDATGSVVLIPGSDVYTAPTLRAAIDAANDEVQHPGADVISLPAASQILVTGNDTSRPFAFGPTAYVINSNITLQGDGVTIDGQNQRRLFGVMDGASLTIQNLTLAHGKVKAGNGGDGEAGGGGGGVAGHDGFRRQERVRPPGGPRTDWCCGKRLRHSRRTWHRGGRRRWGRGWDDAKLVLAGWIGLVAIR